MITKFYVIDGDSSAESPVFVNDKLTDVLASVDAKDYWLFVKPVGEPGMAVKSRQDFVGYMKTLSSLSESVEVVAYLHKSGNRLAELSEILG